MMTELCSKSRNYIIQGGGINGSFGEKTELAVKAYQEAYGLSADDQCGTNTWKSLSGKNGRSASEGMKTGQSRYINISTSSRSWTQTVPSSWAAVNSDVTPCLVGATLTFHFGRGNGTWSATVKNNIVENTLS